MYIFAFFSLPSLVYVLFRQSSPAVGLVVICAGIAIYGWLGNWKRNAINLDYLVAVIPSCFILVPWLFTELDLTAKQILSVPGMFVGVYGCGAIFNRVRYVSNARLLIDLRQAVFLFAIAGLCGAYGWLQFGQYAAFGEKTAFPFPEPSHLALALGPVICALMVLGNKVDRIIGLVCIATLSLLLPSLTGLTYVVILALLFFRLPVLVFVAVIIIALVFPDLFLREALSYIPGKAQDYFLDRLSVNERTQNLSWLVYAQGWDIALGSLIDTKGLGLGFQNLGRESSSRAGAEIWNLFAIESNRLDGGFLAAKLIAELGLFGVGLIFVFLGFSLHAVFSIARIVISRSSVLAREGLGVTALALSIVAVFPVEILVRGLGYFSPQFVLFIASITHIGFSKSFLQAQRSVASRHSAKEMT